MAAERKVIGYCRVSTMDQGRSGLGLEAQYEAITQYCERQGYVLVRIDFEVASGGLDETGRPVLAAALEECQKHGHTLVVNRICRLARSNYMIERFEHDLKVAFEVTEMGPAPDGMAVSMQAIFAESERHKISIRTREALAAKRARGEQVGSLKNLNGSHVRGGQTMVNKAAARIEPFRKVLSEYAGQPFREIARELNDRMVLTPDHGQWSHQQVARALKRLELV
jgi:DNA invertase Pin-like site-specific DNA recombinase